MERSFFDSGPVFYGIQSWLDAVDSHLYAAGTQPIPDTALKPRLVDDAELLSGSEREILKEKLDEISVRQSCDVIVVTVYSLGGKTAEAFADDYFDYNGYGYRPGRDGILFLVSMEYRDWHISTHGYGLVAITDYGLEQMEKQFRPLLSAGDYYGAFSKYADLCDEYIRSARNGRPIDVGYRPDPADYVHNAHDTTVIAAISAVIAAIIALIATLAMKGKLKTIRAKTDAWDYSVNSLMLSGRYDNFLYQNVSRTRIDTDSGRSSGGHGGGSSSHSSSSGSSHGGGGGKF